MTVLVFSSGDIVGRECYEPGDDRIGRIAATASDSLVVSVPGRPLVQSSTVVPLPMVGEVVELSTTDGLLRGYWVGAARVADPTQNTLLVRVLAGTESVERTVAVAELDARVLTPERGDPVVVAALREMEHQRIDHDEWKLALNAAACARADDLGWCGDFDDFMHGWGMDGRTSAA